MTSLAVHALLFPSPPSSSSSPSVLLDTPVSYFNRINPRFPRTHQWLSVTHSLSTPPRHSRLFAVFCAAFRRHRRQRGSRRHLSLPDNSSDPRPSAPASDDRTVHFTVDVNRLSTLARSRLDSFVSSGMDAYGDLRTLITFDEDNRIVVSCRRSTVQFVGSLVVLSFVAVFALKVAVGFVAGFGSRFGGKKNDVVVRRDRSLGGREVVVGKRSDAESFRRDRILENPLSPAWREDLDKFTARKRRNLAARGEEKLPNWWPNTIPSPTIEVEADKDYFKREANRLVREIIDNRLRGKDITDSDIVQLRRLCRTSGIQVFFGTENTRDSFYRVSVDFVLNMCNHSSGQSISAKIDGEDPRQFLAGLAENIGVENVRAARIVSAAVAARTRSVFLQAWALEMQGEHPGAVEELSKICTLHQIFPPRDFSPEMEMVALGLEKQLKPEQREFLMNMLVGVCGEETPRSLAEALGLELSPDDYGAGEHRQRSLT